MVSFIPASELKKTYDVFGHFYSIAFDSGDRVDCRSVLELVHKQRTPADLTGLSEKRPDAVCIMMNPGSSKPLCEVDNVVTPDAIRDVAQTSLVPTRPDITQYQLMRVMHYCGWDHVRILNLSDLRDPKSGQFVDRYTRLEMQEQGDIHSLFSPSRSAELALRLGEDHDLPVICAWGVSPDLDPLIGRCMERIAGYTKQGLLKEHSTDKYFHPLPTLQRSKEAWVVNMVASFRG